MPRGGLPPAGVLPHPPLPTHQHPHHHQHHQHQQQHQHHHQHHHQHPPSALGTPTPTAPGHSTSLILTQPQPHSHHQLQHQIQQQHQHQPHPQHSHPHPHPHPSPSPLDRQSHSAPLTGVTWYDLDVAQFGQGPSRAASELVVGPDFSNAQHHPDGTPIQDIMEQIETQVTDLRYLSQAPVPLTASASPVAGASSGPGSGPVVAASASYNTPPQHPQTSPRSASAGDNSAPATATPSLSNKRKFPGDDSLDGTMIGGKQTRSKRNRYISIACNECKRRKIKCNGETPCQRCGNLNLACLYAPNCCSSNFKDSDDFKLVTDQIRQLQDEVNWLNQTVKTLQSDPVRALPAPPDRMLPAISATSTITRSPSHSSTSAQRPDPSNPNHGSFRGTTSMAYNLDVANTTISNMGYQSIVDGDGSMIPHNPDDMSTAIMDPSAALDPLLEFDKDEMVRLCRLHEEEIGIMYPVLDIQTVITHARSLASVLESLQPQRRYDMINDEKTLQLKMVMCCALVVEEHAHSERAIRLYNSMESVINRKLMSDPSSVSNLPLLALLAGYRFLSNDEVLAWRVMGQVARLCLELGINMRMGLQKITDEHERKNALNSFWTAYVLDRRWAFATGLPFVIQDDEIDPQLPLPDEYPYLVAMITYSKIAAKVWRQVSHFGPILARELRQEEIERLDQEILQWYETVPEEVKVRNWDKEKQMTSTPSYNLQRLRIWTYLRLNQIRIWLYTPVLYSATSIMSNPSQAQKAVELAKDTIQYLHNLNSTTNLYRRLQVFYHQFLTSAISAVFLASVHAPVRFSVVCREEFYLALDLVKDMSAKSWVSQRLWRTIRSLKDVAPRFGLNPEDDPHSSAALGMIGLARGHVNSNNATGRPQFQGSPMSSGQPPQGVSLDQNGALLQSEMSRIFEGYVGLNGVQQVVEDDGGRSGSELPSPDSSRGVYGADSSVYPHLREMY